jgi:CheY-like chemotaxis protein
LIGLFGQRRIVNLMRRGRILIVEDENIVARDLAEQLTGLGHSVIGIADHAEAAIDIAARHTPDLALMDIRLRGELDGAQTAAVLRRRFGVPSIFLSGFADDATIQRAQDSEPFGFVIKPCDERLLHITVQSALYRRLADLERATADDERRRAERAEAVARLASNVVHEFNNLLSAIRCNAYIIQTEGNSARAVAEAANDIASAVTRGETLMNDLSGIARERRGASLDQELAELVRSTARHTAREPSLPPQQRVTPPTGTAVPTTRGTVLVVDDDAIVRRAVTKFLKAWGCTVIDAKDPNDALVVLEREQINVMLTDLVMPQMSGYELGRKAVALRPGLRVIYMSGYAPEALAAEFGEPSGLSPMFLQKPFEVDALKQAVTEALAAYAQA